MNFDTFSRTMSSRLNKGLIGMFIRLSLLAIPFVLAGCQLTPKPAPLMVIPKKPPLKKTVFEVAYTSPSESARVKSVQLPAHAIHVGDSVSISAEKVPLTDTLRQLIVKQLEEKGLTVVDNSQAHYTLTLHQLDLDFAKDRTYQLQVSGNNERLAVLSTLPALQECKSIIASVSMRLTHKKSSDVVWFAKASVDSGSFVKQPLRYQVTKEQKITNEQSIIEFVEQQNTEESRLERRAKQISIPKYQLTEVISPMLKQSGVCNETEVSALSPDMHAFLSKILIDKVNISK